MNEIEKCFSCGEVMTKIAQEGCYAYGIYRVKCLYCGSTGPFRLSESAAVKAWNEVSNPINGGNEP